MAKRTSIYLDEFGHRNPIPVACRVGNLLMSSIIVGRDTASGLIAPTLEEQCALIFQYMRNIVQQAGGSTADIIKVTIWLKDRDQREPVNREWLRMFPDPKNRPARESLQAPLDEGKLVQCDFTAVIDD